MMRYILGACATFGLALALAAPAALADPVITGVSPGVTAANTGATVTVTGTGFGYADDRVYFPGTNNYVLPTSYSSGSVTVRVPATWSGNVQVQTHGSGVLSNGVLHDITFSYDGHLWPSVPPHWRFNTTGAPAGAQSAVQTALNTWSCVSDFYSTYDGTTASAPGSYDGVNAFQFVSSGWGNPNTIAVTTWWWNGANQRLESDMAFNTQNFTWATDGSAGNMDIQNIATHEAGHWHWALDLYGADDVGKCMYGYSSNGDVSHRVLVNADAWGAAYAYGQAAGRADLDQNGTPSGWYAPLTPRSLNDATTTYAPLPATLPGGGTTYLNISMTNSGGDCAMPWSTNRLYIDDSWVFDAVWSGNWGAGLVYGLWTNAAMTVRGGRHTLRIDDDILGQITESNESNNRYDIQYVWSPLVLATDTPTFRSQPPYWGPFGAPNCDGFQYQGDWWGAVAMIPSASNDDYDVRLYDDYANSTTGFSNITATSAYGGGANDWVVWDNNVLGSGTTRWVGNTAYSVGSAYGAYVEATNRYAATALAPSNSYGTSVSSGTVSMAAYDLVKVHELYLSSSGTTYRIQLTNLTGSADLNISLVGGGTGMWSRANALLTSQNVGGGTNETIDFQPPAGTVWFGVVVWKNGTADLGQANTYQLSVGPKLTDLDATVIPGSWDGSVVPRNDASVTGIAQVSPVLDGNTNDTYLNYAVQEISPNAYTPGWGCQEYLDDAFVAWGSTGSNTDTDRSYQAWNIGTITVRGGRHTLTNWADPDNVVAESNEGNNTWSGQWIWSPLPVTLATPEIRYAAPVYGTFAEPNSDALQVTRHANNAWVVGEASLTTGDDYDLVVYSDYSNSTTGLSTRLAFSDWGGTATDFVVGHYVGTPTTVYPAVIRFTANASPGNYTGDQNDSYGRYTTGAGQYLNQVLGPYRVVDVYEGNFTAGIPVYFQLLESAGPDLAFEVFPPTTGGVYPHGGGTFSTPVNPQADNLTFTPSATGWHPIVVYKFWGYTSDQPATYSLLWNTAPITGVDPRTATELALAPPSPSPFASSTRVSFTLPQAGRATLAVYDVGGRRVAALADGEFGPGSHDVVWDGTSAAGTPVTDGLYWIRLQAAGRTVTQRVARIH